MSLTTAVLRGANDYVFEPVKAEVKKGDDAIVSVRLKHKATGKPVTDAMIVQTRIDMSPDGMAEHGLAAYAWCRATSPASMRSRPSSRWPAAGCLSIAAKVQGEPETVVGKITFRAT